MVLVTQHIRYLANDCIELPPPKNGAKACDDWARGRMCSPFCNGNWDFTQQLPPFAVWSCGASGIWFPSNRWPDCTSEYDIHFFKILFNKLLPSACMIIRKTISSSQREIRHKPDSEDQPADLATEICCTDSY